MVNLRAIEALIKKEVRRQKVQQKSQRHHVDLEVRKLTRKTIADSNFDHPAHLMMILMRVWLVSEENQYIKETDLIKVTLLKNPFPENINSVRTLHDFLKDIHKDKKKQMGLDLDILKKTEDRNRSWVHYQGLGPPLSQPDYPRKIQWSLVKKLSGLWNKPSCYVDEH